jgi:hypothetical protein
MVFVVYYKFGEYAVSIQIMIMKLIEQKLYDMPASFGVKARGCGYIK